MDTVKLIYLAHVFPLHKLNSLNADKQVSNMDHAFDGKKVIYELKFHLPRTRQAFTLQESPKTAQTISNGSNLFKIMNNRFQIFLGELDPIILGYFKVKVNFGSMSQNSKQI